MKSLQTMKECLVAQAQSQMGNLASVDAKELGEVIDMIKDLEEAIYYCTITEAMNKKEEKGNNGMMREKEEYHYFHPQMPNSYDPWSEDGGRMYYASNGGGRGGSQGGGNSGRGGNQGGSGNGRSGGGNSGGGKSYYEYPIELRDYREGQSPKARRMYMESKEMHHDKTIQMKELEKYMRELGSDISEMIEDATPEERELLKNKLTHLVQKIDHN